MYTTIEKAQWIIKQQIKYRIKHNLQISFLRLFQCCYTCVPIINEVQPQRYHWTEWSLWLFCFQFLFLVFKSKIHCISQNDQICKKVSRELCFNFRIYLQSPKLYFILYLKKYQFYGFWFFYSHCNTASLTRIVDTCHWKIYWWHLLKHLVDWFTLSKVKATPLTNQPPYKGLH